MAVSRKSTVPYPSAKAPVHPTKLLVRQTLHQLKEFDVDFLENHIASRNLFSIAKHTPERIPILLEKIKAADQRERLTWRAAISSYQNHLCGQYRHDAPDNFTLISILVPHIAPRVSLKKNHYSRSDESSVMGNAVLIMRDVYESLPEDETFVDVMPLFKGAELYLHLETEYRRVRQTNAWTRGPYKAPPRVNRENIKDVVFMAKNYDAVINVLPEIKRRKTHDRDLIAVLIDAPTSALIIGAL